MEDFIKSVVSQLGIDESTAESAAGTTLGFLKNGLGDEFSLITDKLPGASQLIDSSVGGSGGGGLMGSLAKAASSVIGGEAGEGLELMGSLQKLGLSPDQISSFVSMLIDFIKDKVGAGVFDQIADKIPALKSVLG